MKTTLRLLPAIALCLTAIVGHRGTVAAESATAHVGSQKMLGSRQGVWVFSCDGRFARIGFGSNEFSNSGSLIDVLGKRASGRFDGCLVENVSSALKSPALVAVVPKQSVLDTSGKRHYAVLGLDRSSLSVIHRFDILTPQEQVPDVALSSSGSLLKIVYEGDGRNQRAPLVSQDLDVASFRPVASRSKPTAEQLRGSRKFFFRDDGWVQVDDGVGENAAAARAVLDYSRKMLGREAAALSAIAPVGSAFGMVLYMDGWDTKIKPARQGRLIAFDTLAKQVVNGFEVPFAMAPFNGSPQFPNVHISPDGSVVVVEEYEWSETTDGPARVKTGLLAAYEVRSGAFLGKATLPATSRSGRVLAFSDDGRELFYATSDRFFVIDTTTMLVSSAAALPPGFSPIAAVTVQ